MGGYSAFLAFLLACGLASPLSTSTAEKEIITLYEKRLSTVIQQMPFACYSMCLVVRFSQQLSSQWYFNNINNVVVVGGKYRDDVNRFIGCFDLCGRNDN